MSRWSRIARLIPFVCAGLHLAALVVMAWILRGGLVGPVDARASYIADQAVAWKAGWVVWMLSALSLVCFYAWWAAGIVAGPITRSRVPLKRLAALGVLLAAVGMLCDFAGEGIIAIVLAEKSVAVAADLSEFLSAERTATLLTAGWANALYTVGGIALTSVTPNLPRWIRLVVWCTWAAGAAMTVSAVLGFTSGIVASTIVLFPLLIVWVAWMGMRWRPS